MRNGCRISWSDEAKFELQKLVRYMEENWTEREIEKFISKLDNFLEIISIFPEAFPATVQKEIRRAVLTEQTSIIYQISGKHIYIVSIFDNRKTKNR